MEYPAEIPAVGSICDKLSSVHFCSPSQFELLPPDIIWKIIEYAPEKIFALRKTSTLLLRRVYEFATQRKTILPCSDIQFHTLSDGTLSAKIRLYSHTATLLKLWIRLCQINQTYSRIEKSSYYITYFFGPNEQDDAIGDWKCLLECTEYRIRQLFFDTLFTKELSIVSELLNGVQIENMAYLTDVLTDVNSVDLMNTIIAHKVNKLTITVKLVSSTNPVKVLLDLSSLVQSLMIIQKSFDSQFGGTTHDLFGVCNGNWAAIFAEMFSRKLDKLYIVNHLSGLNDYVTWNRSINALEEKLPLSVKPLWFKTAYDVPNPPLQLPFRAPYPRDEKTTFEQNNHVVCAEIQRRQPTLNRKTFSVKHISRMHEPFNDAN